MGENAIWPTNIMFVIVKFLDYNNWYTMSLNFHFKILYVACLE